MTEDVYFRLGERLNENPTKWLLDEVFLGFLREYYTDEQAALGAALPLGKHSLGSLAKQLNRDEGELLALMNAMADNGQMFTCCREFVHKPCPKESACMKWGWFRTSLTSC